MFPWKLSSTVTKALVLCPLLEDRGHITESAGLLVPIDRMKQKCFRSRQKESFDRSSLSCVGQYWLCCVLQDFGKYPRMRTFIQEYIQALSAQNDGIAVAQRFVKRHVPGSLFALLLLEV